MDGKAYASNHMDGNTIYTYFTEHFKPQKDYIAAKIHEKFIKTNGLHLKMRVFCGTL